MQVQHMQHARCTKSEASLHREHFYIDFSILLFFDMQMLLVFSLLIFNFFFCFGNYFSYLLQTYSVVCRKPRTVTIFRLNLPATLPHKHTQAHTQF